jgi:hypothetical protein
MSNSNEDRLLRSALGRTAECVPVEQLESLDARARAHIDKCAYCRNELAMMLEFRDAAARPEEAEAMAWMQTELERRLTTAPPSAPATGIWARLRGWFQGTSPSPRWLAAPVAASVILLLAGGMYLRHGGEVLPRPGDEQVWRSQSFAAVAPAGDVTAAPVEMQWEAVPGTNRYLVRVMEVDRTEIWRGESAGSHVALPAEILRQMTPGRTFLWTVTARDVTGSTLAETRLQTFHILATSR